MTQESGVIVFTSCPDAETADRIGTELVNEGLAACVSILPPMRSIYRWKGKIEDTTEFQLIIKSTGEQFTAIMDRIKYLHPYELPEIIAVRVADGLPDYLRWLQNPE